MPAVAALIFANGEGTPVNHTFTPYGQDAQTGVWIFRDAAPRVNQGVISMPLFTVSTKAAKLKANGQLESVHRINARLAIPHLETLGTADSGIVPPPQVAYTSRVGIEYLVPPRCTAADRADIAAYGQSIASHATIKGLVTNLDSFY